MKALRQAPLSARVRFVAGKRTPAGHHVGVASSERAGFLCSLLKTAAERAGDRD
jgi:hypothetical protein